MFTPVKQAADSGGSDVHWIGFAVLDNFGVAARDRDSGVPRGFRHGANFGFEHRRGQSGFENIGDNQGFRPRSRNREIVHGSVHGKFSDGAARKTQRLDHETVGGDGDLGTVDVEVGGIAQRS